MVSEITLNRTVHSDKTKKCKYTQIYLRSVGLQVGKQILILNDIVAIK